jgi:TPR repeat protein
VWADLDADIDCVPIHVAAVRWKRAHMAERKFQRLRDLVAVVRLGCHRRDLGRLAVEEDFTDVKTSWGLAMQLLERLFPKSDVRKAFQEIDKLEQSLPSTDLFMQLGFSAIKGELRQRLAQNPDRLSWALQHGQKLEHVVLIQARNIALEELASGNHMTFGTMKTMTGDGLVSLFNFLTSRFEEQGIETPEQAKEAKIGLDEMIQQRFGTQMDGVVLDRTGEKTQELARQAASMNWVSAGTIKKDGLENTRLLRGDQEAVIWQKTGNITLVVPHCPLPFDDFIEIERFLAREEKRLEGEDEEKPNEEMLFYREIEKEVTRNGYFEELLSVQGTDEEFCIASMKIYKSGYWAGETPKAVATNTLEAVALHEKDRSASIEFLVRLEKDFRSAMSAKQRAPLEDALAALRQGDNATALRLLRPLAEQGNAEAQYNLGAMYGNGLGVRENNDEALKWERLAADQGHAKAQFTLGLIYASGFGVPENDVEAAKWYRLAADQGDAEAQAMLGGMYARGAGVPEDNFAAEKWYRRAADQGHANAKRILEIIQKRGSEDSPDALKWHRSRAEQGDARAQLTMGNRNHIGRGVPQNYEEAAKWYRLSADQGSADAQYMLGMMYKNGQGVAKDEVEAAKWFRLSAEQGNADAQFSLGYYYHGLGRDAPQNYVEAAKWYRLAAEQGNPRAQLGLGLFCVEGRGVPTDYVQAYKWFSLSAAQGIQDGIQGQSVSAKYMTAAQIDEAQKLAREWKPKGNDIGSGQLAANGEPLVREQNPPSREGLVQPTEASPDRAVIRGQSLQEFFASFTPRPRSYVREQDAMMTYAKERVLSRKRSSPISTQDTVDDFVSDLSDALFEMRSPNFKEEWRAYNLSVAEQTVLKVKDKAEELLKHHSAASLRRGDLVAEQIRPEIERRSTDLYYGELTDNLKWFPIEPSVMYEIAQRMTNELVHPDAKKPISVEESHNRSRQNGDPQSLLHNDPRRVDPLSIQAVVSAVSDFERLVDPFDRGDRNGIFHQAIIDPMKESLDKERTLRHSLDGLVRCYKQLKSLGDPVKDLRDLTDFRTGRPFYFRRKDLIAIALNVGDYGESSNFQTLTEGYKWRADDVVMTLDRTLSEKEWEFVAEVYKVYAELLEQSKVLYREVTGIEFEPYKIVEQKFKVRDFNITVGGYYPQMFDLSRCTPEPVSDIGAIRTPRYLGTGFRGDRLIRINFDLILPTIASQIHDLAFRQAIIQTMKLIPDDRIKETICNRFGAGYYDDILKAAKRVWSCEYVDRAIWDQRNNSERDAALGH